MSEVQLSNLTEAVRVLSLEIATLRAASPELAKKTAGELRMKALGNEVATVINAKLIPLVQRVTALEDATKEIESLKARVLELEAQRAAELVP